MTAETKRFFWVDVARVSAIFLVIINHLNEKLGQTPASNTNILLELIGRSGVPIFLILTGYLMVNRDYTSKKNIDKFTHKNLLPIVYSSIFWTMFFSTCVFLVSYPNNFSKFIRNILFQNQVLPHMWYIQMLPVVYAFIPLLGLAKKFIPKYLIVIISIGISMLSIGNIVKDATHKTFIPFNWNLTGSWSLVFIMLSFIVIGSYFDELSKKKLLLISTIITFITSVLYLRKNLSNNSFYSALWYDHSQVFLLGILLAFAIKQIVNFFEKNYAIKHSIYTIFANLSKITYGIYIVHYPFIYLLLKFKPHHGLIAILLYSLLIFITSTTFMILIKNMRILPSFLFLTKKKQHEKKIIYTPKIEMNI